jgi:hypothetical protein
MPLFQPDQYLGRVIGQASECNEKSLFSDTKLGVVMKRQQGEMQRCIGTDGCVAPWTAGRLCRATAMARRCWSEGNQAAVSRHNAWKWERPRVSDGSCERHECRSRIETATELRRRPFRGHLRITQDSTPRQVWEWFLSHRRHVRLRRGPLPRGQIGSHKVLVSAQLDGFNVRC